MRISDWSSDVCSSDLVDAKLARGVAGLRVLDDEFERAALLLVDVACRRDQRDRLAGVDRPVIGEALLAMQDALHVAAHVDEEIAFRRRGAKRETDGEGGRPGKPGMSRSTRPPARDRR